MKKSAKKFGKLKRFNYLCIVKDNSRFWLDCLTLKIQIMNYKVVEDNGMFFILDERPEVVLVIDIKDKTIADLTGDKVIRKYYGDGDENW